MNSCRIAKIVVMLSDNLEMIWYFRAPQPRRVAETWGSAAETWESAAEARRVPQSPF